MFNSNNISSIFVMKLRHPRYAMQKRGQTKGTDKMKMRETILDKSLV